MDALAASGLRTIRFSKEIPSEHISQIYANDLSENATHLMKKNFELNEVDMSKVTITNVDANSILNNHENNFHVVDIDPYGTSVPFLDAFFQGVKGETLLCCTNTDLKVLCGPDSIKCFSLYGACKA